MSGPGEPVLSHPAGEQPRTLVLVRFAPWSGFSNSHPHDLMWPVSMLYAASIARREGWTAHVVDQHVEPLAGAGLTDRICSLNPDLVLIDTMTPTLDEALRVSAAIVARSPATRVWGVGQHASERPEDFLQPESVISGCLLGEYEANIAALLAGGGEEVVDGSAVYDPALGAVRTQGGKQEIHDCDALPPLDPTGIPLDSYELRSAHVPSFRRQRWGFLVTSRGCPYSCTFCSPTLRQSFGRSFRAQSAEQVVDDICRLNREHGVTAFYMHDDVFSMDRERVVRICEELIRRRANVHWVCQTRANFVDRELLTLMKRAGCCAVKIGIESGSDRILRIIKKGATRKQLLEGAKAIREAGLFLTAYYMLGNPTETLEEMHETFEVAQEIRADMIQVAFHTAYPGSETFREYASHITDPGELSHYNSHPLNLSDVSQETLERLQRQFYLRYYLSPSIFWNYLRRRALYRLTDTREWSLAFRSLAYLLLPRRRRAAAAAAAPPASPRENDARVLRFPVIRAESGDGSEPDRTRGESAGGDRAGQERATQDRAGHG